MNTEEASSSRNHIIASNSALKKPSHVLHAALLKGQSGEKLNFDG